MRHQIRTRGWEGTARFAYFPGDTLLAVANANDLPGGIHLLPRNYQIRRSP